MKSKRAQIQKSKEKNDSQLALSRRSFLKTSGATGVGAAVIAGSRAQADEAPQLAGPERSLAPFYHGVASGDPEPNRVILWTRVSPEETTPEAEQEISVAWQVATDPQLSNLVASGVTTTDSSQDYTVKVDAQLPTAATTYYYQFSALDKQSLIGRTRTAPEGDVDQLRFAVASCSSIYSGYLNGYDRIADRNDLDLVLHCGDYIYDYPDGDERVRIPLDPIDEKPPETLAEARRRYGFYRLDPTLRRAHQQHPWVTVWDNHDLTPDDSDEEKAWAQQAFHEWMPIRTPNVDNKAYIYRKVALGGLVDIICIDRHLARDPVIGSSADPEVIFNDEIDDEDRTHLGEEQLQWFLTTLSESTAKWRIIVNQVMIAQLNAFGFKDDPNEDRPNLNDGGFPLNPGQWDGYPAERRKIFQHLRNEGINNNLFVTGDMHMSFACDLVEDPYNPELYNKSTGSGSVGVEFMPTSISRGNIDEELGVEAGTLAAVAAASLSGVVNPHIKYADFIEHGYGIVNVTEEKTSLEFWYTPIRYTTDKENLAAVWEIPAENNALVKPDQWRSATVGIRQDQPAPEHQGISFQPNKPDLLREILRAINTLFRWLRMSSD